MNNQITGIPGRSRWTRVGTLIFISYLVAFADRTNIGVAAPLMARDLGFDLRMIAMLLSAFFWGYILTQMPGGWLAQRIGPVRVVGAALIVTGITASLTGVFTDVKALFLVRVLLGIAEGVIWPSFAVLFIRWFPGNERARAVSIAQYAIPISSVVMAPLAGWLIDKIHWQAMFVIQGIPAILMGIIFIIMIADDPEDDKRLSEAERQYILLHRNQETGQNSRFIEVLSRPTVWLLGLASLCWIMVIFSFGLWMPSIIKRLSVDGYTTTGFLTAIPFVFGAISMYLNARFSDQTTVSRGWFVAVPILFAGIALFAQHYGPATLSWSLITFSIAGAGLYSGAGTWWSWAISMLPRNHAGPAIGMMNIFASFGGIVGPMAVGYFAKGSDPASSFYMLGYSLFLGSAIMLVLIMRNSRLQIQAQMDGNVCR